MRPPGNTNTSPGPLLEGAAFGAAFFPVFLADFLAAFLAAFVTLFLAAFGSVAFFTDFLLDFLARVFLTTFFAAFFAATTFPAFPLLFFVAFAIVALWLPADKWPAQSARVQVTTLIPWT